MNELTATQFAERLLEKVVAKRAQNKEVALSLLQLELWLRECLDPAYTIPAVAKPPLSLQLPVPEMQPGEWLPGVGRYTGQGSTAQAFDSLANPLGGEE